jgi:hypothetical protein
VLRWVLFFLLRTFGTLQSLRCALVPCCLEPFIVMFRMFGAVNISCMPVPVILYHVVVFSCLVPTFASDRTGSVSESAGSSSSAHRNVVTNFCLFVWSSFSSAMMVTSVIQQSEEVVGVLVKRDCRPITRAGQTPLRLGSRQRRRLTLATTAASGTGSSFPGPLSKPLP